jgi:hypothetical protein
MICYCYKIFVEISKRVRYNVFSIGPMKNKKGVKEMKKLAVVALLILAVAVVTGCGKTASETGSSGSYYHNPSASK